MRNLGWRYTCEAISHKVGWDTKKKMTDRAKNLSLGPLAWRETLRSGRTAWEALFIAVLQLLKNILILPLSSLFLFPSLSILPLNGYLQCIRDWKRLFALKKRMVSYRKDKMHIHTIMQTRGSHCRSLAFQLWTSYTKPPALQSVCYLALKNWESQIVFDLSLLCLIYCKLLSED